MFHHFLLYSFSHSCPILSNIVFLLFFSYSKILSPSRYWPFFARPGFLSSPEKSFELPVYAEMMAECFAQENCSPPLARVRSHDPCVLDFMDISAVESTSISISTDTDSFNSDS
jgi:hypothetical protein